MLRNLDHGQLSVSNQHHTPLANEIALCILIAHLPTLPPSYFIFRTTAARATNFTLSKVGRLLNEELLKVSLAVSFSLEEVPDRTTHVQEGLHFIRDYSSDTRLNSAHLFPLQIYQQITIGFSEISKATYSSQDYT